ncbi:capping complex subunit for YIEGIA [Paenibacillus glycanilyticus]|uniref:Uncharacterized protein n=1 Tax=Paenibacillus glycanilyticus TaxID=126569 RepID=A0ABQ6GDK7_9BACL|nr:hypothetical protein [Paenibacillus glycanilyticus]GLX68999.1 hypothetical protein MU1_33440 [Paenibacillus glycanilyticus]
MAKIVAVVAVQHEKVGGGAPIFIEPDEKQMQQTAFLLEKILDASAHDLKNGTIIIVNHH